MDFTARVVCARYRMVVSFDTGPTWANWAAEFKAFKTRYPGVEMVYNDLGSAATVVTLDKSKNRPQADSAYYFAASALDAASKGLVADFKPVNFDRLPEAFRHARNLRQAGTAERVQQGDRQFRSSGDAVIVDVVFLRCTGPKAHDDIGAGLEFPHLLQRQIVHVEWKSPACRTKLVGHICVDGARP